MNRRLVLTLSLLATAAQVVVVVIYRVRSSSFIQPWQASQYWLDYSGGFVRRGLPGEVFALLTNGPLTHAQMSVFAVAMTTCAAIALLLLGWWLARVTPEGRIAAVVMIASPFTLSLFVWDIGRYDALGVIVIIGIVAWSRSSWAVWAGLAFVTVGAVVATESEEFLLAFIVPVVVLAVWKRCPRHRVLTTTVVLTPAIGVALGSLIIRPSASVISSTIAKAQRAGVNITDKPGTNAVSTLALSIKDNAEFVSRLSLVTQVLSVLVMLVLYIVPSGLMWHLLGRTTPTLYWRLAALYGVFALALGFVGVDYRRWWGLAFIALAASHAILLSTRTSLVDVLTKRSVIVLVLTLSVVTQPIPVYPIWDPASSYDSSSFTRAGFTGS